MTITVVSINIMVLLYKAIAIVEAPAALGLRALNMKHKPIRSCPPDTITAEGRAASIRKSERS